MFFKCLAISKNVYTLKHTLNIFLAEFKNYITKGHFVRLKKQPKKIITITKHLLNKFIL